MGTAVHLFQLSPRPDSVQNQNGPWGFAVPKGPLVRRSDPTGIPAPRFSCREPSINPGGDYPTCRNGVKAILARLNGRHAEHHGDGGAHGRGIGQVDLFDNVPQYLPQYVAFTRAVSPPDPS
jgi:hypothetical protein